MQHFNRYKLGVDLKRWREKNKFSQFELAACAGLTPAYVSALERFEDHDYQIGYLARVCDAIGVDLRDYISDMGDK